MINKLKYVLFFASVISLSSIGTYAWAGHGGHGGGHAGHGWGGGHGGSSWHGGHGHFDGHNHFAGWGRDYGWGHGYRNYFYGGYWPYLAWNYLYGGSYRSYYRPYATYSYPSYGYPYHGDDCDCNYTLAEPSSQYIANRPVDDAALVEEELPEPDVKLWAEGQPVSPTSTARQFESPVLNAPEPSVYTSRPQPHDGDPLLIDGRNVDAKAGSSVVVNFNQPQEMVRNRSMPQPTPASGAYAKVSVAELRDWLRLR